MPKGISGVENEQSSFTVQTDEEKEKERMMRNMGTDAFLMYLKTSLSDKSLGVVQVLQVTTPISRYYETDRYIHKSQKVSQRFAGKSVFNLAPLTLAPTPMPTIRPIPSALGADVASCTTVVLALLFFLLVTRISMHLDKLARMANIQGAHSGSAKPLCRSQGSSVAKFMPMDQQHQPTPSGV
jgi:hypothetical protein